MTTEVTPEAPASRMWPRLVGVAGLAAGAWLAVTGLLRPASPPHHSMLADALYEDAGATISGDVWTADVVVKVAAPSDEEIA